MCPSYGRIFRSYGAPDLIRRYLLLSLCQKNIFSSKAEQVIFLFPTYLLSNIYIRSFNKALLKLFRSSTNVLAFLDQDYFQLSLNQQFMTFLWEVRLTRN